MNRVPITAPLIPNDRTAEDGARLRIMTAAPFNMRKQVIGGSLWSILTKGVQTATAFLSVPLTLHYLGTERMGLWRMTISMLTIVSLLSAGLIPYMKTRMAEAFSEKDTHQFAEYSSTSLLLGLALVLLGPLVALSAALFDWVSIMKVTDAVARRETLPLVMTIMVCTFAQFGTMFIPAILDAGMQLSKPRVYELIGSVLGFLMLLLGIHLRVSLPRLAAATVAPGILIRLLMLPGLFQTGQALLLPHCPAAKRILREMLRPALLGMGIQCGSILIAVAPNFIVVRLLSLMDLTVFSISYQVATLPLIVLGAMLPVFWPAFTATWRTGSRQNLGRRLAQLCGGTAALSVLYAIGLGVLGPWAIRRWTHEMVNSDRWFLFMLGIFTAVQGVLYWLSTFMWSVRELRMQMATQAASAVMVLVLGFLLAGHYGLVGLALAMIVSIALGALGPMGWWAWKLTGGYAEHPGGQTVERVPLSPVVKDDIA